MRLSKRKVVAAVVVATVLIIEGIGAPFLPAAEPDTTGKAKEKEVKPAADFHEVTPPRLVPDGGDKWLLGFRFTDPRLIHADVPGRGRKDIWYFRYEVTNATGKERTFVPEIELSSDGKEADPDPVLSPETERAIRGSEDLPKSLIIRNSPAVVAEPVPPARAGEAPPAVAGVAAWEDADLDCSRLRICVVGLSSEWGVDGDRPVRRKTLELDFKRDGDGMRLILAPRWFYYAPKRTPPEPGGRADEFRRTIAGLRKELADAKVVAGVVDKDQALARMMRDLAAEHEQNVALKIKAETLGLRCNELEKRIDALRREKEGDKTGEKPAAPAPDQVEGLVKEVVDGLVKVTVGSDAGLAKGQALEVYRLDKQNPDQPKFLGRVRIVEVTPTAATGETIGRTPLPIQAGDLVRTRIVDK